MSDAITPPDAETQADLPGLAEAFRSVGIDNLPTGVAELSHREQRFCLEYLRTGLWTASAKTAGYRNADKHAGSLRKNVGIRTFLSHAARALTEETKQLVIRAEERSRGLQELLRVEMERPLPKINRIAKLAAAVNRTDALLGALKGIKGMSSLHVSGDVQHNHQGEVAITVPATALPVLAQMRREVVESRGQQPLTVGGN